MTTTNTTTRADDARLHELLNPAATCIEHGKKGNWVYSFPVPAAVSGIKRFWFDVPRYHEDANDARTAELALAPELQGDYARELAIPLLAGPFAHDQGEWRGVVRGDELYALITATPTQRAQALVAVLERAGAKE